MAIKLATWNLLDGFSKEHQIEDIVGRIERIDPDVAVLPEAFAESEQRFLGEVDERFEALGYVATLTLYDDSDGRLDRHGLVVINRLNCIPAEVVRLQSRNALRTKVEGVDVLGVHLDDRDEQQRLNQARKAIAYWPRILMGDLNSVTRRRAMARVSRVFPAHYETVERPEIGKLKRASNVVHRVGLMASSHVSDVLQNNGYYSANINREPTWPSQRPMLDLDQVWWRDSLGGSDITVRGFEAHDRVPEFDHLPISAILEV